MSKQVHTHRLTVSFVMAAIVVAASLSVIAAFGRDKNGNAPGYAEASGAAGLVAAVPTPAIATATAYTTNYKTGDPAHAASMLIVGTLLIGIGSMVRRAA